MATPYAEEISTHASQAEVNLLWTVGRLLISSLRFSPSMDSDRSSTPLHQSGEHLSSLIHHSNHIPNSEDTSPRQEIKESVSRADSSPPWPDYRLANTGILDLPSPISTTSSTPSQSGVLPFQLAETYIDGAFWTDWVSCDCRCNRLRTRFKG